MQLREPLRLASVLAIGLALGRPAGVDAQERGPGVQATMRATVRILPAVDATPPPALLRSARGARAAEPAVPAFVVTGPERGGPRAAVPGAPAVVRSVEPARGAEPLRWVVSGLY
ncbi:MAG TPA: hypothetical protein VFQ22_05670 [Longimicrobiales bacterium]|nr:hypothetical protein [Longimicrobiales bacterium]